MRPYVIGVVVSIENERRHEVAIGQHVVPVLGYSLGEAVTSACYQARAEHPEIEDVAMRAVFAAPDALHLRAQAKQACAEYALRLMPAGVVG